MADPARQLNFLTNLLQEGTARRDDAALRRTALELEYGSPQARAERTKALDFLAQREELRNTPLKTYHFVGPDANEFDMVHFVNYIAPRMEKGLGIKWDSNTDTWTRRGRQLTAWDLERNRPLVEGIVAAQTDPEKRLDDLEELFSDQERFKGADLSRARSFIKEKKAAYKADPTLSLREWRDAILHYKSLHPNLPKLFDRDLTSLDSKIKAIEAKQPKEGDKITYDDKGETVTEIWVRNEQGKLEKKIYRSPKWSPKQRDVDKDESDDEITLKELTTFNKEVEPNLYHKKGPKAGQPRIVDSSTRNRMDFVAEKLRFRLNWEKIEGEEGENRWRILGVVKVGSLEDVLHHPPDTGTTVGTAIPDEPMPTRTNDPLGIRR